MRNIKLLHLSSSSSSTTTFLLLFLSSRTFVDKLGVELLLDPSLSSRNEHTLVFYHRCAFRKTIDVVEKILDVVRNVLDTGIDFLKVILVHSDNTFHCFRHGLKLSPLLGTLRFREL
mgnify:CR=1 FL=1